MTKQSKRPKSSSGSKERSSSRSKSTEKKTPRRLNALKHGITCLTKILPWEDPEAYDALRTAMIKDYQPVGVMEERLVEELVDIQGRKERLRLAEASVIKRRLSDALKAIETTEESDSNANTSGAAAMAMVLPDAEIDAAFVHAILRLDEDKVERELSSVTTLILQIQEAVLFLQGSEKINDLVFKSLEPETIAWLEKVKSSSDEEPDDVRTSLYELEHRLRLRGGSPFYDAFLAKDDVDVERPNMALVDGELPSASLVIWRYRNRDLPRLRQWKALLENYHQVREQVFGDAYDPRGHDHIVKHDVALDRKLERTLSTLLKLQEIRRNRLEAS